MSIEQALKTRANSSCELCASTDALSVYEVPPVDVPNAENCVLLCQTCKSDIENQEITDANHWRCLGDSMWSQTPVVQVMAWRMLNQLDGETWAQDLLDMLYLEDELLIWAKKGLSQKKDPTLDSNGAALKAGDNVTLIKDLVVKGANFTAKRGTAVRNISLSENPEHIEGKVNGTRIVIIAAYVKKM